MYISHMVYDQNVFCVCVEHVHSDRKIILLDQSTAIFARNAAKDVFRSIAEKCSTYNSVTVE